MRWLIILSLLASVGTVRAQNDRTPQAVDPREEEISQRAKRRVYPGGPDAGDLRVQNPLPTPVRKVAPAVEDEKPESSAAED
ncbi:MAG: hypothetical protein KF802_13450 [Bdellovibrionaceae bacterium]|nr:hypothetical protein [Pseudobdellovibrionaceae bacterium]MBX3034445.1 hypothetical protein [Pseudobdellovibrionaceae bacterium]